MKTGWLRGVTFLAAMVGMWQLCVSSGRWDPTLLPGPAEVVRSLARGIADHSVLIATAASLRRLIEGYSISLVLGILLGMGLARIDWLDDTVGWVVLGLQTLPSVCWLPMALLWFGLGETAILFVTVMGALLAVTVAVKDGVRNVPPIYDRAAKTLGTGRRALYLEVLLPASLPAILMGAKLGWSFAWRSLMAGELLSVGMGLGHLLTMGRELGDMSQVLTVMLVIICLGLVTDRLIFGVLERQVRERWGLNTR